MINNLSEFQSEWLRANAAQIEVLADMASGDGKAGEWPAGMVRVTMPERQFKEMCNRIERPLLNVVTSCREKHPHYHKSVQGLTHIDFYRICALYGITDRAIGHAFKKLLVAGGRGGGKNIDRDVAEAIDTLQRWQEIRAEDAALSLIRIDDHA